MCGMELRKPFCRRISNSAKSICLFDFPQLNNYTMSLFDPIITCPNNNNMNSGSIIPNKIVAASAQAGDGASCEALPSTLSESHRTMVV